MGPVRLQAHWAEDAPDGQPRHVPDHPGGVECPDLVDGAYARNNYWQVAEDRAAYWFGQQKWGAVGLGINSWDGLRHPINTPQGIAVCDSLLICK
ncbi:hypothetical protein [Streptomyces sp. Isolate_219]|uniref:hypothetical protein n=1 Tax=Streptomyces sp. Isolate_219 TaxID=2950110 RepID=UPI0021C6D494|nr:hypothetical protein [Streptomyces sp. Isolate_219]MCR8574541.1 hypothetical protein [Streptomyces sp. Isolate_219]